MITFFVIIFSTKVPSIFLYICTIYIPLFVSSWQRVLTRNIDVIKRNVIKILKFVTRQICFYNNNLFLQQYIFLTETLLVSRARVARLSAPSALISSSLAVSSWSGESVLAMEGCRGINVNFSESKYRSIEKLSNIGIMVLVWDLYKYLCKVWGLNGIFSAKTYT